jgi:adenosylcobinamide-phosphate synthase
VAVFGIAASRLERAIWHDSRTVGAIYATGLVGATVGLGALLTRGSGRALAVTTAAATWAVLGGRSLVAEAQAVHRQLSETDLPGARQQLTHLVGRRTEDLDEHEIVRATIESVAENTSDAVAAPLFWGAVAGVPGLLGYRALNTLDAMVGHHNPRYENFGWAAARADDFANYVPARLSGLLTAVVAPLVAGRTRTTVEVVRRDGRQHPSPNAGIAEAAFAGALGVRLGGRNIYGSRIEDRPVLGGDGRQPVTADISRTATLSRGVTIAAALACAALSVLLRRRR